MLQGDFLETILEETSDDLQSDSDRSGTTYWLGSDSETESVIHIKAGQRFAGNIKHTSYVRINRMSLNECSFCLFSRLLMRMHANDKQQQKCQI